LGSALSVDIDRRLDNLVAANLNSVFPAITLNVIYRGKCLLHRAWGWIDADTESKPVKIETLFDLASVTKLFTVTAFLSLVSEGQVGLDDALVTIIPEFGEVNPRSVDGGQDPHTKTALPIPEGMRSKTVDPTRVTFRHLLTHTSGLAPWRDVFRAAGPAPLPPDQNGPVTRRERWARALKALCAYPFVGEPGSAVRYSDLGLMLLGEAVSHLHSGESGKLDAAIYRRVIEPLVLPSITFNPVQAGIDRDTIAPTEDDPEWRGRRCRGEVHDENACGAGGVAGHAGLFGRVGDIAAFGQAWLSGDERLPIDDELRAEAVREQAETDGHRRGLGWLLKAPADSPAGDRMSMATYGHTGFTGTSLFVDPERQLVVALLTNRVYLGREVIGIHAFRRALHSLIAEGVG
jgi:CubicO group peptidase (beta-lactamase class C family)